MLKPAFVRNDLRIGSHLATESAVKRGNNGGVLFNAEYANGFGLRSTDFRIKET